MHPRWKLVYCTYAVSIEQGTYDCGSEGLSSLHHGEVVKKEKDVIVANYNQICS